MEEFVNEIIRSLQDNPEMVLLGGTAVSIGALKGRKAASYALDEVSKAVYDPINYSTSELEDIDGPVAGYLADRRIKWDEKNLGSRKYSRDHQMSDD